MRFIQVGAHIGNDEAFDIIKNYDIELGILIEPLPQLIPKLKKAYKDIPNIIIENKAIAVNNSDSISFYIDKNNIYWKLISNISNHNENYDLIKSDTNTYISDVYNLQIENFNPQNYPTLISNPTFFVWTDKLAIISVIIIVIISMIIYNIYRQRLK